MRLEVSAETRLVIEKRQILLLLYEIGNSNPDNPEEIIIKSSDIPEKVEVRMKEYNY